MTRRRWGLLSLAVVLLGYALGQEWISITSKIPENHTLDFFVGISAALSGVVALDRRPGNRIGWLLVGMAVAWHAEPYLLLEIPTVTVAAWLVSSLYISLVGHLVLAFPTGRLQTRLERGLVISFYTAALIFQLAKMAVYDPHAWGCDRCVWQPAIWPSEPAYGTIQQVAGDVTIVQVLGFAGAVVLRFARSSRVERHDLQPLWVGTLLIGVIEIIGAIEDPSHNDFVAFLWQIRAVLLILVPLVFLYGVLTDRTARSVIGDLVLRLEHDVPAGQLGPILAESLGDPQMRIVYATAEGDTWVAADGSPVPDPAELEDRNHAVTVIRRDHRPYAALIHDRALPPTLVTGVAATAALSIENEWLQAELKAQLDQVRASRARIVAAGHEERRKVERDLHDGAQQRLLTLALALRAARRKVGTGDGPHALSALDQAEQELKLAIEELRELARGIHPTILTDEGLEAALSSLAARATLPVAVAVELPHRLAPAIEATAYFAVSEALANVSKHSGATSAAIDAHIVHDHLTITVTDDGCGGADTTRGSGLRGLRDRVAAAEGTLEVTSPVGSGTQLRITLPVPVQATP